MPTDDRAALAAAIEKKRIREEQEPESKPDLAQVIGTGLVRIMRQGRTSMMQLEADFDAYVATLSFEQKKQMKADVETMVKNAGLAVESIYVRVRQSF